MYYEDRKLKINWVDCLIKLIVLIILFLIIIWLFPQNRFTGKYFGTSDISNVKVDLNITDNMNDKAFSENLTLMKEAAQSYYTIDRLPANIGEKASMTLKDMYSRKLLLEFKDAYGNSCDTTNSYVEVTKTASNEYELKVNLVCGEKSDYTITILGCYDICTANGCNTVVKTKTQYQHKKIVTTSKKVYYCGNGYTLSNDKKCYKAIAGSVKKATLLSSSTVSTYDATLKTDTLYINVSKNCPSGYTDNGSTCIKTTTSARTCPSGYSDNGSSCTKQVPQYESKTTYTTKTKYCSQTKYCTAAASTCTQTVKQSVAGGGYRFVTQSYSCGGGGTYACGTESYACGTEQVASGTEQVLTGYKTETTSYIGGTTSTQTANYVTSCSDSSYEYDSALNKCKKTVMNYVCKNSEDTLNSATGKCITSTGSSKYVCSSGYKLVGTSCFKASTLVVSNASYKTKTVSSYSYKWSDSKTLAGWTATGKTRTIKLK